MSRFKVPFAAYAEDAFVEFHFTHLLELQQSGPYPNMLAVVEKLANQDVEVLERALELGLNNGVASEALATIPTAEVLDVVADAICLRLYGKNFADQLAYIAAELAISFKPVEEAQANAPRTSK